MEEREFCLPDSAADRGSDSFKYVRIPKQEKHVLIINLNPVSSNVKSMLLRGISHFSGEYENQGSPGSPLPDGTTWPAAEGSHGPGSPEPPPGPQMPEYPAAAGRGTDAQWGKGVRE